MGTMVQRSATCDPNRLEQLLRDRLPEDARRQVEAHLFLCPGCRDRLDELAGGARWWGDVRRYLGNDGASEQPLPTMDHPGPRRWPDVDLRFLQACDNPAALGSLGGYEVYEVLGQGGWGIVLKAFDLSLHRPVAIKVLVEGVSSIGTARKRFAREARAAAAVVHDHVVPVYAVNAEATPPYLVMAFIPGQSLQQRLDRSGPLDVKEVLRIGMQTAAGLAAAHAQGLVHRDIKPANIMLENGIERVRITDFGLARAVDDASVTSTGAVAGTPQYMAPEQARGEAIDQRADLFALGSTLYAMCTGQAPFRGDSGVAVIRQVCDVEPRSIRALDPELPAWLEGIVRKLHAKVPAERFQSAAEVADLLEGCLAHVQHPARFPLPALAAELGRKVPDPRLRQPRSRRRPIAAAVLLLALTGGLSLLFRPGAAQPPDHEPRSDHSEHSEHSPNSTETPRAIAEMEAGPGFEQIRDGLSNLQRSLTTPSTNSNDPTAASFSETAQRADQLRRDMSSRSDVDLDPVTVRMQAIRQQLEMVRRQLGGQAE
jgi:eukaryotic-like serine/threonine-protein kinase